MDIRKVYEYALRREQEGREFFSSRAKEASHSAVVSIFEELAEEETKHIEYLEKLLAGLDDGGSVPEADERLSQEGQFASRAEKEMLNQTVREAMVPDVAVLRVAYLIERDLAEFYESVAEKAEGEAKKALSHLATWERNHERLFKSLHDSIYEEYTQMPWGG